MPRAYGKRGRRARARLHFLDQIAPSKKRTGPPVANRRASFNGQPYRSRRAVAHLDRRRRRLGGYWTYWASCARGDPHRQRQADPRRQDDEGNERDPHRDRQPSVARSA
jgi:hypothetical protein